MPLQPLIPHIPREQVGSARVFRAFNLAGRQTKPGDVLTEADLAQIAPSNWRTLIEQRFMVPAMKPPKAPEPTGEVHVYNRVGTSTYDVVVGHRLNDQPLSKTDAETLAARHRAHKTGIAA